MSLDRNICWIIEEIVFRICSKLGERNVHSTHCQSVSVARDPRELVTLVVSVTFVSADLANGDFPLRDAIELGQKCILVQTEVGVMEIP